VAFLIRFIDQLDADDDEKNAVPLKFIQGCFNDMVEARRRWDITRQWREENGVDAILGEPQPYFDLIKECYPHFWICRSKTGSVVYVEQSGKVDAARMLSSGLSVDDLVRYYVFLTEYTWTKLSPEPDGDASKSISVFDIDGVT